MTTTNSEKVKVLIDVHRGGIKFSPEFQKYLIANLETVKHDFPDQSNDYLIYMITYRHKNKKMRCAQNVIALAEKFGLEKASIMSSFFEVHYIDPILKDHVQIKRAEDGSESIRFDYLSYYQKVRTPDADPAKVCVLIDQFVAAVAEYVGSQ